MSPRSKYRLELAVSFIIILLASVFFAFKAWGQNVGLFVMCCGVMSIILLRMRDADV